MIQMNRRERRKEETRKKIIDTAMGLFAEQGFQATSMEQIANATDIAKATLYSYFPVKEAIICEYVQRSVRDFAGQVDLFIKDLPDTRSRLLAVAENVSAWAISNKDIVPIYVTYRFQNVQESLNDVSKRSGFHNALARIILIGQSSGDIRRDMPGELLAGHLEMMHSMTIICWFTDPARFPLLEGLTKTCDLFLNGANAPH